MKPMYAKTVLGLLLSFLTISTVYANWQCQMHNSRGDVFYGIGDYRKTAAKQAMGQCAGRQVSSYAINCRLDYCSRGNFRDPRYTIPSGNGRWKCSIANRAGSSWVAYGSSRVDAASNAMGMCAGIYHSNLAKSCAITYCGRY